MIQNILKSFAKTRATAMNLMDLLDQARAAVERAKERAGYQAPAASPRGPSSRGPGACGSCGLSVSLAAKATALPPRSG